MIVVDTRVKQHDCDCGSSTIWVSIKFDSYLRPRMSSFEMNPGGNRTIVAQIPSLYGMRLMDFTA
jgi:hypothetical protein